MFGRKSKRKQKREEHQKALREGLIFWLPGGSSRIDVYLDYCVIRCLELLPPHVVIHRLTGDGPGNLLIAPQWSRRKRAVLNLLHQTMARRNTWQGRRASHVPGETGEIPASLTCTP